MEQQHAEFKKIKVKKAAGLAGYDVYAWSPGEHRTAWIIFGGDKDAEDLLAVDIAWDTCGSDLAGLEFIPWHKDMDAFPAAGAAKLTARAVVGSDFAEKVNFEILPPPVHVQEAGLENITHSELFRKVTANKVAAKLKNDRGLDPEEVASAALAENLAGNRLFFRLWSHCAKWVELSAADIDAAIQSEMERVVRVLGAFGIPFLQRRLT